jgi:hypothetical protein
VEKLKEKVDEQQNSISRLERVYKNLNTKLEDTWKIERVIDNLDEDVRNVGSVRDLGGDQ